MMINSSPLISIVMPTYNRAKLIAETIESIQKQTYENWELIIVDDGSEDNTEELIRNIVDTRIQFYKAGRIGVSSKIKNIGLKKATGDLIAFADSDDLWAKNKLKKQLTSFQQFPEAQFCLCNGYDFTSVDQPISYFYLLKKGIRCDFLFTSFFKSELAATIPTLIVKREALEIAGNFNEILPLPDVTFILNLALHFKGIVHYEPLFFRRVHETSDSKVHHLARQKEGIMLIKSFRHRLPQEVFNEAIFKSYINSGEECLKYLLKPQAIQQFVRAWKYKPFSIIPIKKIAKAILHFI